MTCFIANRTDKKKVKMKKSAKIILVVGTDSAIENDNSFHDELSALPLPKASERYSYKPDWEKSVSNDFHIGTNATNEATPVTEKIKSFIFAPQAIRISIVCQI